MQNYETETAAVVEPCSTVHAESIAELSDIYQAHVNVAVHRRALDPQIARFVASTLLQRDWEQILRVDPSVDDMSFALPWASPDDGGFRSDLRFLVDIYAELFGSDNVGVRMVCGANAMCPRFHVDKVVARMVCTYEGPGTEWLDHAAVRREHLGHASKGLLDELSGVVRGPIQRMHAFDIGILKGEMWAGNQGRGAVHRSPCPTSGRRVFVSLEGI